MAKGKKYGGKDFAPGNCANPNGRPKVPEDLKIARALTQVKLQEIINELIALDKIALQAMLKDPKENVLRLAVASVLAAGIGKGDQSKLDFVLGRLLGKVPEVINLGGELKTKTVYKVEWQDDVPNNNQSSQDNSTAPDPSSETPT